MQMQNKSRRQHKEKADQERQGGLACLVRFWLVAPAAVCKWIRSGSILMAIAPKTLIKCKLKCLFLFAFCCLETCLPHALADDIGSPLATSAFQPELRA